MLWVLGIVGGLLEISFSAKKMARPQWLRKIYWPAFFIASLVVIFLKSFSEVLLALGVPFLLLSLVVSALVVFGLRKLGDIVGTILSATEGE
jgi:hypothetical protein